MSRYRVWAVLGLLGSAWTAFAQSTPTTFAVVQRADRAGQLITVKQAVTEYRPVARTVRVTVDGKVEERTVTEYVPAVREEEQELSLKGYKPYSGEGKALGGKQLRERLRPGAVVVLGDERLLQLPLGKLFRPEAVLLVGKSRAAPEPARPAVPRGR